MGRAEPSEVLGALDAYRNPDGGYGWGLEPDLRSPESQPAGALHALEVFAEVGPATSPRALELCDWLVTATLPDGGLPFARRVTDPAGCAPFWAGADPDASSLHITSAVCGMAHRVARHDAAVASHAWLASATEFCLDRIEQLSAAPHAIELMYILHLLDALTDSRPQALALLERAAAAHLPRDGTVHVAGGRDDECLRPLDYSPLPDRPLRALIDADAVAADIARWKSLRQDDGGWVVDFDSSSPIAALEWRGYATVRAITLLRDNRS